MRWRRKTLLLKMEVTYGTDPVPTGAADAVLAFDVELNPIEHEEIERDPLLPYYGGAESVIAGEHVTLAFSIELAGSGAAGTVPAWGPGARICGLAETNTPAVDTQYDPVSTGEESGAIYLNIDGTRHAVLGFRGKSSLDYTAGQRPMKRIEGVGLLVAPTAAALPTLTLAAWKTALDVSEANTPTFTLHGYAAVLQSLKIDLGQEVVYRNRVNGEAVEIVGRKMTGSVTIDAPALATKDFFAISRTDPPTLAALQLIHGNAAGEIIQVDAPKVQILPPAYTESDGLAGLEMGLKFLPDTGDDELKITVK